VVNGRSGRLHRAAPTTAIDLADGVPPLVQGRLRRHALENGSAHAAYQAVLAACG
jgi:hypothetical protein